MPSPPPFSAERYVLQHGGGRAIDLLPLEVGEAEALGEAFAAMDPWRSYPYPAAGLTAYLAKSEPGAPRFLIRSDRKSVGALGLRLDWLRGPYLQFLGVLEGFQGQGLGRLALDWIEGEARAANQRNLWVAASDFNQGAIRFYEREGYRAVAALDGLVQDGRAEILMRKRL